MELFDRLRQFEVLSHFSDEHLNTLAGCTSRVRYPEGVSVFKEGDESQDAYLIDTGVVRIQRTTPYGLYALADLHRGELFGESSFIDGHARSGEAMIPEDASLFPLNPRALDVFMREDQRFQISLYWAFWKSMAKKLRTTNEQLAEFFAKGRKPPTTEPPPGDEGSQFRVGLDAKKSLFQEQKLTPIEINLFTTLSKEHRLDGGEEVFQEGQMGDRMYIVLEGKVLISKQIAGAGEEALAILERGDYFGEMALIDNQPRSADAKAHEDGAVVLSISRDVLENVLGIHKPSSIHLLRLLCNLVAKRLREVDDKLIGWYIFSAGSGGSLQIPE